MKTSFFLVIAGIALMTLTGCGTAEFNRPPGVGQTQAALSSRPLSRRVEVVPFQDMRNGLNSSDGVWLCLIPLWPYGRIEHARPEDATGFVSIEWFKFVPTMDLARAAAAALEKTNLFRSVAFAHAPSATEPDYTLRGIIYNTEFKGRVSTYGLSWLGVVLWPFGFPVGQVDNRLAVQLQLLRRGETEPRWEYIFDRRTSATIGLYYNLGGDVDGFSEMMTEALEMAFENLASALDAKPLLLE